MSKGLIVIAVLLALLGANVWAQQKYTKAQLLIVLNYGVKQGLVTKEKSDEGTIYKLTTSALIKYTVTLDEDNIAVVWTRQIAVPNNALIEKLSDNNGDLIYDRGDEYFSGSFPFEYTESAAKNINFKFLDWQQEVYNYIYL